MKSLFSKIALALVLVSVSTQAFSGLQDFRKHLITHPKAKAALRFTAFMIPHLAITGAVVYNAIMRGKCYTDSDILQPAFFQLGIGLASGCLAHGCSLEDKALMALLVPNYMSLLGFIASRFQSTI